MDRLKSLLTQEGINFTDTTFKTEDGIERLGEQPFVSVYLRVSIQFPFQNCFFSQNTIQKQNKHSLPI